MSILKSKLLIFITIVFLGFLGWWISFQHVVSHGGVSVEWFDGIYGIVALYGSIVGFVSSKKFGGWKAVLGRSLFFFSLALFFQEAGQQIANYYVYVMHVGLPYPAWDDAAYFSSTLAFILGALYLAKAAGVKLALKKNVYKFIAFIVMATISIVAYTILLHNHQFDTKNPLSVFLDIGYPVGDALYVSIAVVAYLLSRKLLGGVMKPAILFLIVALLIQYSADFTFIYQGNRNTYVPGSYDDLLYFIAYFATSLAMINFLVLYKRIHSNSKVIDNE